MSSIHHAATPASRKARALAVATALLFAACLAVMAYFTWCALAAIDAAARADYSLLDQVKAVRRDVDLMNAAFNDVAREQAPRRLDALAEQVQRVHVQLQALGAKPGQAAPAAELADAFDAWFGRAVDVARMMLEPHPADPGAAFDAMQYRHAILQRGLEQANLRVLRRVNESVSAGGVGVRHALQTLAVAAALVLGMLGLVVRFAVYYIGNMAAEKFRLGRQVASTAGLVRPPSMPERQQ